MVSARLVLLLAALMLLATPLVNSVPSDYVAPEEADIAATGDYEGCLVGNFTQLSAALSTASSYKDVTKAGKACKTATKAATITVACGPDRTFSRGGGAPLQLDADIANWKIKSNCYLKAKPVVDITIDYTGDKKGVAVLAATGPISGDSSFALYDLNFVFSGQGECSGGEEKCAIIKVDGFKEVTFGNMNINSKNAVAASSIPASGIHIVNADKVVLDKVSVKQVADHGIVVEGGAKVKGTTLSMLNCGKHGLKYKDGCYKSIVDGKAQAWLALSGPKSFFKENGGSGLYVDCDFAPSDMKEAMPVELKDASFSFNKVHGIWLRGTLDVAATKCAVNSNGGSQPLCGGGVRVVLRNTGSAKTSLALDGTRVTKNKAKYGAGVCFQARMASGVSAPYKASLLKLKGNPWLKDNEAQKCGGGMATIGNMVEERMAIAIDKGVAISGNTAEVAKTWCDVLDVPGEETVGPDWEHFKPIWFLESD